MDKAHKYIRKERGRLSNIQGKLTELSTAEKVQAGEGWFKGMEVGELNDINAPLKNGKGYQIDIYGEVGINGHSAKPCLKSSRREPQKTALAIEVKEWNRKIYIGETRKFIEALKVLQRTGKASAIVGVYISKGGFSKSAAQLLEENGIYCGTPEDFGL